MAEGGASAAIEPSEDREIYEQLARLQGVYNQVFALRTLLPDRLVNPTRAILQASNGSPPEKLAAQLKEAAVTGSCDIQRFKKDYHSDEMRELFRKVNSADISQGDDVWGTDYGALVRRLKSEIVPEAQSSAEKLGTDDLSDLDVIKRFQEQNPKVEVKMGDETTGLPCDVTVDAMVFRVEKSTLGYQVVLKDNDGQTGLAKRIASYIKQQHAAAGLCDLLTLLASYTSARGRKCEKCGNVFDDALDLPLYRKQYPQRPDQKGPDWMVLHSGCVS